MDPTPDLDLYPEELLRAVALENAELRELLTAVAQDLERLACDYPELAERFLARAMRLRKRLHDAIGRGSRHEEQAAQGDHDRG